MKRLKIKETQQKRVSKDFLEFLNREYPNTPTPLATKKLTRKLNKRKYFNDI